MKKIKVIVTGASGRMGTQIAKRLVQDKSFTLFGATESVGHPSIGKDIGQILKTKKTGILITDNIIELFAKADAVIDFTVPKATLEHAKYSAQARIVHVIGTTGFSKSQLRKIDFAAQHATIIKSGNMSLGINLLESIVKIASSKLDSSFDIKINETHHKHKIDAPSGTAIMLGKAAASGKNKKLENVMKINRTNTIGKNIKNKIVMSSFRKGETIGDHEVMFSSNDETIRIQHIAENRGIFANGALQAVKWGMDKGPGLFSMTDVLNI